MKHMLVMKGMLLERIATIIKCTATNAATQ